MSLQVNVIEARSLAAADSNGFSDPYAIVYLGTQSMKTKTKQKTLNPVWNEIFNLKVKNDDSVTIEVWDWDALSSDDFLGQVRVGLRELQEGPVWYALEGRDHSDQYVQGEICLRIRMVSLQSSKSYDVAVSSVKNRLSAMKSLSQLNLGDQEEPILDLSSLSLTKFPSESVTVMLEKKVKRVDISFNSFVELPDLGAASLREITASGNPMTDIATIGYMTTLTALVLNGTQLSEIPPAIGKLKLLEKLEVANNQLAKLPIELGRLNRLEELNLNGNPLTNVPPHMGGLISLEILDLSNCQLTKLPEEFTLMTRLMELLETLPDGIGRMTRLVSLNLMDNDLSDLPLSIGHCIGLGKIGAGIALARNPIVSQEMFNKYKIGVDHLLDYLERRLQLEGPAIMAPVTLPADLWPPGEKRGSGLSIGGGSSSSGLQASPGQVRAAQAKAAATPTKPNPSLQPSHPLPPHLKNVKPTLTASALSLHPTRPLTQEEIDGQLGSKVVVLKNWGITTCRTEIRPKLIRIKLASNRPGISVNDLMAIGQAVKQLKAEADKAVPFVSSRPPPSFIPTPADKIAALQVVLANTIDDIVYIVDGLIQVLQTTAQINEVLLAIQTVKAIKPVVDAAPPHNPV